MFDYGKHNQPRLTSLLLDVISFIKNVGNCYSISMRHRQKNILLKGQKLKNNSFRPKKCLIMAITINLY